MNRYPYRPAGDVTPAPVAAAEQARMALGADGRIAGLDGVLDQIGEALSRQVTPLVRDNVLPFIQRDKAMQREVGAAAGRAAANALKPILWTAVGLGALAIYLSYRSRR